MNIFEEYIANSFSGITDTPEVLQVKQDLLQHMNEKYEELLSAGLSAHEAIGSVIADFGAVDELLIEMGLKVEQTVEQESVQQAEFVTLSKIRAYLETSRKAALLIASGVAIILLGVALGLFIEANGLFGGHSDNIFGIVVIIAAAIAVGMFIYGGTSFSEHSELDDDFLIKHETYQIVQKESHQLRKDYQRNLIIGIVTIILAPIYILVAESFSFLGIERNSVSIFLMMIAFGVFILIFNGITSSAYDTILKKGKSVSEYYSTNIKDTSPEYQNKRKAAEKMRSLIWSIVVVAFLVWGFIFDGWGIAWIVFPITGILSNPILSMIYGVDDLDE